MLLLFGRNPLVGVPGTVRLFFWRVAGIVISANPLAHITVSAKRVADISVTLSL